MNMNGKLHPGESPQYPLDRRLGGPESWSGHGAKRKKSLPCLCQELNPSHPTYSVVTILNELLQLDSCITTLKCK